jgi:hypothetical protein
MSTPGSRLGKVLRDPSRLRAAAVKRLQVPVAHFSGLHDLRWRLKSRQALFTQVYESNAWDSSESGSGTGSELRATENIRKRLPDLLSRLDAQSVLEPPAATGTGCGTLNCQSATITAWTSCRA